jgi:hypothetical protein
VKLIVASLVVFTLVILFLFALFPSDISVTRLIQIRAPENRVREKIADLRLWKDWNEFVRKPATSEIAIARQNIGADSVYIDIGSVRVNLSGVYPDSISTVWRHGADSFTGNYYLKKVNDQTIVEWTLRFHVKWYPWTKLASMFYDKEMGPVMEKSLINLQKELETAVN